MITQQRLKELLHYDADTGVFTWLCNKGRALANSQPTSITESGYLKVTIDGVDYRLHRLAFLYMNGKLPSLFVDHKDGDKLNNSFSNLRECTKSQNGFNVGLKSTNTSGCKGVSFRKDRDKWRSYLRVGGQIKHLGYFEEYELAALVATEARDLFHGEFARHV